LPLKLLKGLNTIEQEQMILLDEQKEKLIVHSQNLMLFDFIFIFYFLFFDVGDLLKKN